MPKEAIRLQPALMHPLSHCGPRKELRNQEGDSDRTPKPLLDLVVAEAAEPLWTALLGMRGSRRRMEATGVLVPLAPREGQPSDQALPKQLLVAL